MKYEDLFQRKKFPDRIKPLVDEMDKLSENLEFEKAKSVLENIKEELKRPETNFPFQIDTIKDVNDLIKSHAIRLNPENYKFSDFLGLLTNVYNRKSELKGMMYSDTERQRKIVAEEMVCLGMTIPVYRGRGGTKIKPNRAFLDIAQKVNPSLACKELERREKVLMWKAIESGKKEEIERARERLRKYLPKKI